MKTKIILLFFSFQITLLNAQQQNSSFEKLVNQEFGTLLESLLVDGKLDNNSAKAYLETVYGYNTEVINYLQNVDFSPQLNSLNPKNISTLQYVELLNSSLLSAIPNQKFQQLSQNISDGLMFYNGIYDITQGNITDNAIGVGAKIFDFFAWAKETNREWKVINEKIKEITPTLTKLNKVSTNYKKLKLLEDFSSDQNWAINKNPPITKHSSHVITTNYSDIKNNRLYITSENYKGDLLGFTKEVIYDRARFFKNKERFDFSKDFRLCMDIKLDFEDQDRFYIYIGKGLVIEVWKQPRFIALITPLCYSVSNEFGVLDLGDGCKPKKEIKNFDKEKGTYLISRYYGEQISYDNKKFEISFDEPVKLEIIKKGDIFTARLANPEFPPQTITSWNVNYFPDKYYLGFKLKAMNKKAAVEIHQVELEHL